MSEEDKFEMSQQHKKEDKVETKLNSLQMRAAMKMVDQMHPLANKLTIDEVFPICKSLYSVKKSVGWEDFYESKDRVYEAPTTIEFEQT